MLSHSAPPLTILPFNQSLIAPRANSSVITCRNMSVQKTHWTQSPSGVMVRPRQLPYSGFHSKYDKRPSVF